MKTFFATCLLLPALLASALAEDGVTGSEILVGQTCVQSGPTEMLGKKVKDGMRACFERINVNRGIKGRKIKLKSLDDEYSAEKAAAGARKLITEEKVFLMLCGVGSIPCNATSAVCEELKVPFIAPASGSEELRQSSLRQVINIRPSYYQETEALVQYLVDRKQVEKIANFLPVDMIGKSGASGLEEALKRRGKTTALTATFERHSIAIGPSLNLLEEAHPQAVVSMAEFRASAALIKSLRSHKDLKDVLIGCTSNVGTSSLLLELAGNGDGTIISQGVPSPWDENLPLVKEYLNDMKQVGLGDQPSFVSMEGYLGARFFCKVLELMEGEPTRVKFIETVEKAGKITISGIELNFDSKNHNGSNMVILTSVKGDKAEKIP